MNNYTDTDKFAYLRFWEIDKYTVSVFFYLPKRETINTLNRRLSQTKTKTPFFLIAERVFINRNANTNL